MIADSTAMAIATSASLLFGPLLSSFFIAMRTRKGMRAMYNNTRVRRPPLSPPNWIFGPVWTVLYLGLGYSSIRIYALDPSLLRSYAINMILNQLWTPLYFGLRRPGLALVDIAGVWGTALWMYRDWYEVDPAATIPVAAYITWVSFASYLNAGFWFLNRGTQYQALTDQDDEKEA